MTDNKQTKMDALALLRDLRLLEKSYGGTYYWACVNGYNGKYYKNLARFINPTLYKNYENQNELKMTENHALSSDGTSTKTVNPTFDAHFIDLVRTIGCNV